MKNIWKWILGILVVVLVLGAIVAVPLLWHNNFGVAYGPGMMQDFDRQSWRMPMHDFDRGGFDRGFAPMMGGRGFYGYNPFFSGFLLLGGLLRLIVPLGLLALVIWFAYQQGKKSGMRSAAPVAPPAPASEPPAAAE